MFRITEDPSSGSPVQRLAKKLQEWFYRVHWHGQGMCYGRIFWPVVLVCSSLYMKRIHHQGALYSAWLKITRMILSCPLTWTRSVLWQHLLTRCVCVCVVHWLWRQFLHIQWTTPVSTYYILCISWIIKCSIASKCREAVNQTCGLTSHANFCLISFQL